MSDDLRVTFVGPIQVRFGEVKRIIDIKMTIPLAEVEAAIAEARKAAR